MPSSATGPRWRATARVGGVTLIGNATAKAPESGSTGWRPYEESVRLPTTRSSTSTRSCCDSACTAAARQPRVIRRTRRRRTALPNRPNRTGFARRRRRERPTTGRDSARRPGSPQERGRAEPEAAPASTRRRDRTPATSRLLRRSHQRAQTPEPQFAPPLRLKPNRLSRRPRRSHSRTAVRASRPQSEPAATHSLAASAEAGSSPSNRPRAAGQPRGGRIARQQLDSPAAAASQRRRRGPTTTDLPRHAVARASATGDPGAEPPPSAADGIRARHRSITAPAANRPPNGPSRAVAHGPALSDPGARRSPPAWPPSRPPPPACIADRESRRPPANARHRS